MTASLRKANGFTLVELLVVLVVAGILSTLALPSFTGMIRDNRVLGQANDFLAALSLARSEALRRGAPVCVKSKGAEGSWTEGWQVFSEDPAKTDCSASQELIQDYAKLSAGSTLQVDAPFESYIRFNRMGVAVNSSDVPQKTQDVYATPAPDKAFKLCPDDASAAHARLIGISVTGQPYRLLDNTSTSTMPALKRPGSCP